MSTQQLPSLLLMNGGSDRNMCSLNSNIQLLRHIPEFVARIQASNSQSPLFNVLTAMFQQCGSNIPVSASVLRQIMASQVGIPLDSGAQQDTVELLGYLLQICPSELFSFKTSRQYRFRVNGQATSCPNCKKLPNMVYGSDKILKVAVPQSSKVLSLQELVKRAFAPMNQDDGRQCNNCLQNNPNVSMMASVEKMNITEYPPYLFIQLLRMEYIDRKVVKNISPVEIAGLITVDKQPYEILGTVSHMGTAEAGHNRAYLRNHTGWFLCDDEKSPQRKIPVDNQFEQNYCILLKKKCTENGEMQRQCYVLVEKLKQPYTAVNKAEEEKCHSSIPPTEKVEAERCMKSPQDGNGQQTQCQGCGKFFLRLNLHLSKTEKCASSYDMEKLRMEMKEAKRQRSKESMRKLRENEGEKNKEKENSIKQNWRKQKMEENREIYK